DCDVWAIDLLGFGRSAKPNISYSAEVWLNQLHDFITQVIGRPAVIVGNSLGGYAGLCVAAQCLESVSGLILLNSAGPFSDSLPAKSQPAWKRFWATTVRRVLLHPLPAFFLFQYTRRRSVIRKTLLKVYLDSTAVTDQLVEEIYRPSCDPGAAQVFASVFKAKQGDTVDALLADLSCPLLMLWGEGDPWMNTREKGAKFRQYYPTLTEHYLQAGHCPHDEIPHEVNAKIRQWLVKCISSQSHS
ncbi:MAG: alpha/beta fold hydrolase, partial [Symploca sp. SIO3C6]|nr:alpha/beta fold hydrolase [Symploca sp. SIO3C6]